ANTDVAPNYPASYDLDNIVAVAATTSTDGLASFSNYGANTVDIGAPGEAIYSTWNSADNAYTYLSGTSMATPHVTGVFALMRAPLPGETYSQLISRVLAAADPINSLAGKCVTGGRVNLAGALGPSVVADFAATPMSGEPPLTANFTDSSLGSIATWLWNFG